MKRDYSPIHVVVITVILSSLLTILLNVFSSFYHPSSKDVWFIVILIILGIAAYTIAISYSQSERPTFNRLVALLRKYNSLWLIILLISLISFWGERLDWVVIDSSVILLLIFCIATVGYISDLIRRRRDEATIKAPLRNKGIPHPYDPEKSKDKKE